MKFPFGKYVGTELEDVPTGYLRYSLNTFEMDDDLADDIREELTRRKDHYEDL